MSKKSSTISKCFLCFVMQFSFPLCYIVTIVHYRNIQSLVSSKANRNMTKLLYGKLHYSVNVSKYNSLAGWHKLVFLSFLNLCSFKNGGQTLNKAILCCITYSSSCTVSVWERRGEILKQWHVPEIYLREGPHSLIDANTFPRRHTTCSGCQSYLTLSNIEAYYTFYWDNREYRFFFICNEYVTQWSAKKKVQI